MEKESYKVYRIPHNFESQINFVGFTFRLRFLIEGAIVSILISGLIALFMIKIHVHPAVILSLTLCFAFTILGLLANGIDGDPISVYIKHRLDFSRNRRIAYYNPRVKYEANSIWTVAMNKGATPLEKMRALFNKWADSNNKKAQKQATENYTNSTTGLPEIMIFEDDIGFVNDIPEFYSVSRKEAKK